MARGLSASNIDLFKFLLSILQENIHFSVEKNWHFWHIFQLFFPFNLCQILSCQARSKSLKETKFFKIVFNQLFLSFLTGTPVWPGTEITINTCEKIDWLRGFGLHLWFLTSPAASISDALHLYEEAFQRETTQFGAYAKAPRPPYASGNDLADDDETDDQLFDIRFHLLKLYANKAHRIEATVAPKTYTQNPLDCKMGWLVEEILASLGYRHMASKEILHMDFAAQLESMGLWHWAVFVLLHLENHERRAKLVREVLGRNVLPSDEESLQREEFLEERLGVPVSWVAEAKAVRAASENNYGDQV